MLTTKAWVRLVLIVAAFVIFGPRSSAQTISCSSDDGHRHYCPADTRGGVQLVKQRSDSPCQQGYSWGFDRGGVWVDRGCRADFAASAYQYRGPVGGGGGGGVTISCSSDDGGRHYCPATPGRVQLIQQRSQSACREGYSWGQDGRGIWVDHGCRADFAVDSYQYGGGGFGPGSGGGGGGGTMSCSSDDGRRHYCETNGRGRVSLARQRSESACTEGYSWGQDGRGVWVDHGCRADFNVGGGWNGGGWDRDRDRDWNRGNNGSDADLVVSCASDDMHRHYCPADTRGGVRLLKQRSDSSCRQGYSWGFDRRGIWVDHGCRADFQVVR
jgi:hypothetical protein